MDVFPNLSSSRTARAVVPTCVTLLAMFCGYFSVTQTLKGSFTTAAWLVVAAALLDAADGPVARRLAASTLFGVELDSLADLASFGVAPSLLFYRVYFSHWGILGLGLSFLPTMAGALRLARYGLSVREERRAEFVGLSTTASASLLASFLLFESAVWGRFAFPGIAAALVVLSSVLMVSTIRYATLARLIASGIWRPPKGILLLPMVASIVVFPEKAFFPAMLVLTLEGLLHRPIRALQHVGGVRRSHRSA